MKNQTTATRPSTHARPARKNPQARPTGGWGVPQIITKGELQLEKGMRPCHVYFLVHRNEPRFKIGLSVDPKDRLTALPEAFEIDEEQSLTLCLASESRAHRIEKILHRALDDFRLVVYSQDGSSWPGGTEWFHLDGFLHAVDLLEHVPRGRTQETLRLCRLDGSEVDRSLYSWRDTGRALRIRRETAWRENVIKMRRIQSALKAIEPHRRLSWRSATEASIDALGRTIAAMPEMLVVRRLSDLWEPGAIGPRYAMGMSETWMFQTGGRGKVNELRSMVSLIRFSVEKPKDLEIHLIDRKIIQTWPGAALMLRIWDECFQG